MMVLAAAAAVRRKGCGGVRGTNSGTGDYEVCWAEVSLDAM